MDSKTTINKTPNKKERRGKETRQIILNAAQKVFARHPYNAASIRMIATEGDFYHGLIRYHFPNKAAIFEEIVKEICRKLFEANRIWLKEIAALPPNEGLSEYLDRFIEFSVMNNETCKLIIQNLSNDDPENLPGYNFLKDFFSNTRKDFETILLTLIPEPELQRLLDSLNILLVYYLGAKNAAADIIGLDPKSDEYLKWVKETILYLYVPVLERYQ